MSMPPAPVPGRRARRWPALLAIAVGAALMVVFGLRSWHQLEYAARVERGEVRVETLRGWMTLPYIARTYGVPEAQLRAVLKLPASGHEDRSLREWFDATGLDPASARRDVEALILARQAPASEAAR